MTARTAAFAFASVVAIAACLSTASPLGGVDDGATRDGGLASVSSTPQGHADTSHFGQPWMASVLAPAYAAGDAYVITDLGNMFKLDIERPPGINWTQVLLDRIAEETRRSRESVDDLRRDAQEDTNRVRDIINNYIQNNTVLLNERSRQFEQFRLLTNMSIADMLNRDLTLNASINQLVQNIRQETHSTVYQTILDKEAAVSAISSQVHYVYYDNPARIMTCSGTVCDTTDIEPFMNVPATTTRYIVYDDPSWLKPNVYEISPIHYNARYTNENTTAIKTIPGNFLRLYNTFYAWDAVDEQGNFVRKIGGTDEPDANLLVWGCKLQWNQGCQRIDDISLVMPYPKFEDRLINTPVGYPYHINFIAKETSPKIPRGLTFLPNQHFTLAGDDYYWPNDHYIERYGTDYAPFDYGFRTRAGSEVNAIDFDTNTLLEVGMGSRGAITKYFSNASSEPPLPMSGTTATWPNCEHVPQCMRLGFAFDNFIPKGSRLNIPLYASALQYYPSYVEQIWESRKNAIPDSWLIFISPQIHVSTWDVHNTLAGTYSTSPQFIDRMSKRIITPYFGTNSAVSEAGKLYDVRGYARIPFAPETPMNVSHVSLRPSTATLDLDAIGRGYIAKSTNTKSNMYNIQGYEFEKMGLVNCEVGQNDVVCDKRMTDPRTLDTTWRQCVLLSTSHIPRCASLHDIGHIVAARADFTPAANARLPQLEGIYSDALYVPLIQGYSGFRLVIDDVAVFTEYKDIRSNDNIFLSPQKRSVVGKVSTGPIHNAEANVTVTAQVVAPRDGTMNILTVVSSTGTLDIRNEYYTPTPPPPPRTHDPLAVNMIITKNGEHYATRSIGINEHPSTSVTNTKTRDGGFDISTRRVVYDYPSFVFAGTTTVPVSAGDHILFELDAKIDGSIEPWSPNNVQKTRGISSAKVSIDAASIMMGVG